MRGRGKGRGRGREEGEKVKSEEIACWGEVDNKVNNTITFATYKAARR
jgi:hypothetical protein